MQFKSKKKKKKKAAQGMLHYEVIDVQVMCLPPLT